MMVIMVVGGNVFQAPLRMSADVTMDSFAKLFMEELVCRNAQQVEIELEECSQHFGHVSFVLLQE